MIDLSTFFAENFSSFIWLGVFIMALLPVAEGRIAFPFSLNEKILGENVMSPLTGFLTCFIASIFLSLFLLTFFKGFCKLLRKINFFNKILDKLDRTVEKKSEKIKNKNNKYFNLALFVLIPLPLTGVWSASLIATFCDEKKRRSKD